MNDPSEEYQKPIEENASLKQRIQKLEKSAAGSRKMGTNTMRSDKKFEAIFQCSPDVITITDLSDGSLLDVNDSFLQLTGYSRDEVIGSSTKKLNIWGNMKERDRIFDLIKSGANVDKVELTFRTKNGEYRQMLFSARLIEENGRQLLIANTHDITERNITEEKLLESEEKYRTILEDMEDVYFEVDIKGNIAFVNPSSCKKSGYAKEELLGMSFKQISVPDGIERVMQYFGEIFQTGKTGKPFIWNLKKKNGELGFFELVVSLIRDKQGSPTGFRGIGRDITERKQADEKLQQTLDILRKSIGVTIQVMVSAIEVRDPYTAGHQKRVADLARSIATEMGLNKDKIEGIRMAGAIHDIGKLAIPSEILAKPTKLTNIEFSLIKEHSRSGYEMLKNVESPWPLAQIVYQHHERINGSGYPRNLKGDEIIIEARIMAVADVVEAMASHRPYRPGLGLEVALEEIEKNKGITYDNTVADACLRLFRERGYQLQ
jgi:PAS domain S-box-containing protein/putative nucleotidyltransferase with HDIG domain